MGRQTVPLALQVPFAPPQQSWPDPPHATQVDVVVEQVRLAALHGATPVPVQQAFPEPPQGARPVAVTVNIVVLPVTATVTVAVRTPVADGVKVSERVQVEPAVPAPVSAAVQPVTVSSWVLPLVITGTLVVASPPLLMDTDDVLGVPMVTLPRPTADGLADNPAGNWPVAVSVSPAGAPPTAALTDRVALCAPLLVALGAN